MVKQRMGKKRTINVMVLSNVDLSKNGKTRAILGFRAISKNRSAIGMSIKCPRKWDRKM